MKAMVNLCKGVTSKGNPCRYKAKDESGFCGHHKYDALGSSEKERRRIKSFLKKHLEGVLAFLGGAAIDPVASDIYDFIKERLNMLHLIPPVADMSELEHFGKEWKEHLSENSLLALIPYIKLGMSREDVQELLGEGEPNSRFGRPPSFELVYEAKTSDDYFVDVNVTFPKQGEFIGTLDRVDVRKLNAEYYKRAGDYILQRAEEARDEIRNSTQEERYTRITMKLEGLVSDLKRLLSELEQHRY